MTNHNWKDIFPKDNIYYETENGILYLGDALKILQTFPPESIDCIITDPPYGVGSNELNGINYKDEFYNVNIIAKLFSKILKNNTRAYVFTAQKTFIEVVTAFEKGALKLHQTLIWYRPNLAGGTRKKTYDFTSVYEQILNLHKGNPPKLKKIGALNNTDILKYPQPQSNYKSDKRFHIHQKPLKLIEHLILVSTNHYNIILDPFLGSGTTAAAAEKLNRKWIGIEINQQYCEIAKNRINQIISQKQNILPL